MSVFCFIRDNFGPTLLQYIGSIHSSKVPKFAPSLSELFFQKETEHGNNQRPYC